MLFCKRNCFHACLPWHSGLKESLVIGAVTIRAMIGQYKSLGWGRLGCYDMLASLSVLLPRQHAPYNGSYNNTSFDWVLWISLGVDSVATMTCNIRNWCFVTSSWLIYDLQLGLFGVGGDWFSSGELLDLGIWFMSWFDSWGFGWFKGDNMAKYYILILWQLEVENINWIRWRKLKMEMR